VSIKLPDVGEKERRAIARFFRDGVLVQATDANVAEHAMATVIEALDELVKHVGGTLDPRYRQWMRQVVKELPDLPDDLAAYHFSEIGDLEPDAVKADDGLVGYGFVRPMGQSHECGGALFDHEQHEIRRIGISYILLTDTSRPPVANPVDGRT
jgi:hypothetical protein